MSLCRCVILSFILSLILSLILPAIELCISTTSPQFPLLHSFTAAMPRLGGVLLAAAALLCVAWVPHIDAIAAELKVASLTDAPQQCFRAGAALPYIGLKSVNVPQLSETVHSLGIALTNKGRGSACKARHARLLTPLFFFPFRQGRGRL